MMIWNIRSAHPLDNLDHTSDGPSYEWSKVPRLKVLLGVLAILLVALKLRNKYIDHIILFN